MAILLPDTQTQRQLARETTIMSYVKNNKLFKSKWILSLSSDFSAKP